MFIVFLYSWLLINPFLESRNILVIAYLLPIPNDSQDILKIFYNFLCFYLIYGVF